MKHQLKQVFKEPKFVGGFIIIMAMLLFAVLYPLVSPFSPFEMVGGLFYKPGTYVNITDVTEADTYVLNIDAMETKLAKLVTNEDTESMKTWLLDWCNEITDEEVNVLEDKTEIIETWLTHYTVDYPMEGSKKALRNQYKRLFQKVENILDGSGYKLMRENPETGEYEEAATLTMNLYTNVKDIPNQRTFPLGTDNFGKDVATQLASAIGTSLKIGLVAGGIATAIGLLLGLLSGYLGGMVDNVITFIINLFTVIPSFIILLLIASSLGQEARSIELVAIVIGLTSWPWTARSVRAQTLTLKNRDHVNLSKLSGHSLLRILLTDILPYLASYVVMACILQISSGILAEAQLSMLGLGPSTNSVATLGLMMNWATRFQAPLTGAWWAFLPVIVSIALIAFSLNLMNTGLDQVFNPQLRD